MSERCVVIGGGGHAAVVIDALQAVGEVEPVAILDADESVWSMRVLGVPVVGGDDELERLAGEGVERFAVGVGSVGDADLRQRLFELGLSHGLSPLTVIHPSAVVAPSAELEDGVQVMARAVINARAEVGRNALINSGAVVEHDCRIGDHAHVASGAVLAGDATVGDGAFVGAGATVIQGVWVGDGAVVGAGAVVLGYVADGATVMGVPAQPRKVE